MMHSAFLPGDSTVEMRQVPVPEPGHGEVLLKMKASTICGSDIRCIYHEHLGKGPEGYQGVVAGLNSSALGFGRMLGPLAGTGLYEFRPEFPYLLSSGLLVLVLGVLLSNGRLRRSLGSDAA